QGSEALRTEIALHQLADRGVVVNDQDEVCRAAWRRGGRLTRRTAGRTSKWPFIAADDHRQPDREGRTLANITFDRDRAAHGLAIEQAIRQAQAESHRFLATMGVDLGKAIEELLNLLRRHADPGVGDLEDQPISTLGAFALDGEIHFAV